MPVETITSLQNPRLKRLVRLRDRRARDEERAFLVEGYREVRRALERKVALDELYFSRDWFLGENEPALLAAAEAAGAKLFELSKEAFAKVAYRERPDGILAVAPQWRRTLADLALPAVPFVLVVEAIEKPGQPRHDPQERRRGRVRRRHRLRPGDRPLQSQRGPRLHRRALLGAVRRRGEREGPRLAQGARDPHRGHHALREASSTPSRDLRGPLAIVMGSEQYGLSEFWLKNADLPVRIPMAGQADSLNVAMAALITLFEAVRQRRA